MTGPCGLAGERLSARSPDSWRTAAAPAATPGVVGCGSVDRTIVPARARAAVAVVEPMAPLNAPKLASAEVLNVLSSAATAAIVACGFERVTGAVVSLPQAAASTSAAQGDSRRYVENFIGSSCRVSSSPFPCVETPARPGRASLRTRGVAEPALESTDQRGETDMPSTLNFRLPYQHRRDAAHPPAVAA